MFALDQSPIAHRELLVAARSRHTYAGRCGMGLASILMCWLLFGSSDFVGATGLAGPFKLLAHLGFFLCVITGVMVSADTLSRERREGTLGLLLLTSLHHRDVVAGKLVAAAIRSLTHVMVGVPLLALCLLLGGVTLVEVGRVSLALINTLWLGIALGLLLSTLAKGTKSVQSGILLALLLMLLPTLAGKGLSRWGWVETASFVESFGPYATLERAFGGSISGSYWLALGLVHGIAWLSVAATIRALPRIWNRDEESRPRERKAWLRVLLGGDRREAARRRKSLDRSPGGWLSNRSHGRRIRLLLLLPAIYALADLMAVFTGNSSGLEAILLLVSIGLEFLLRMGVGVTVIGQVVRDRDSGALEMLAATPIGILGMGRGIIRGALRVWVPLLVLNQLAMASLVLFFVFDQGLPESIADSTLVLLPVIWVVLGASQAVTLPWLGIWAGVTLNVRKQPQAAVMFILALYTGLLWLAVVSLGFTQLAFPELLNGMLLGETVFLLLVHYFIALWARRRLHRDLGFALENYVGRKELLFPHGWDQWREALRESLRSEREPIVGHRRPGVELWARRFRFAGRVLIVAGLLASVQALLVWGLNRRVEQRASDIAGAYAPLSKEQVIRIFGPVPSELNAAIPLEAAIAALAPVPRIGVTLTGSPYFCDLEPAAREAGNAWVEANRGVLDLVHPAGGPPGARFQGRSPVRGLKDIEAGQGIYFSSTMELAKFLHLAARHLDAPEERDLAFRCVRDCLVVATVVGREPTATSQSFRQSEFRTVGLALRDYLRHHPLDEAQCDLVEGDIRQYRADLGRQVDLTLDVLARTGLEVSMWAQPVSGKFGALIEATGLRQVLLLKYLDFLEPALAARRLPPGERETRLNQLEAAHDEASALLSAGTWEVNWATQAQHQELKTLEWMCLAENVLQIERFRIRHGGTLPQTPEELAASGLALVANPVSGETIYFAREPADYVIAISSPPAGTNLRNSGETSLVVRYGDEDKPSESSQ